MDFVSLLVAVTIHPRKGFALAFRFKDVSSLWWEPMVEQGSRAQAFIVGTHDRVVVRGSSPAW